MKTTIATKRPENNGPKDGFDIEDHSISIVNEGLCSVKVGDKYAKRNPVIGAERFILVDTEWRFASFVMANEAMAFFKYKGKKPQLQNGY